MKCVHHCRRFREQTRLVPLFGSVHSSWKGRCLIENQLCLPVRKGVGNLSLCKAPPGWWCRPALSRNLEVETRASGGKDHPELCRELSRGQPGYQNLKTTEKENKVCLHCFWASGHQDLSVRLLAGSGWCYQEPAKMLVLLVTVLGLVRLVWLANWWMALD